MPKTITPATDLIEISAALEGAKLVAGAALLIALTGTVQTNPQTAHHALREMLLKIVREANVLADKPDADRFRTYAEATIEELFSNIAPPNIERLDGG